MALQNFLSSTGGLLLGIDEAAPTLYIKASAQDPRTSTADYPVGSLVLYVNGTGSALLQKRGTGTDDWVQVGADTGATGLETVASAGALSVNTPVTHLSVTGTVAYTLAAPAFVGQRKVIECTVAASIPAGTVTIADVFASEPTAWVFNAVGQRLELIGTATGWKLEAIRPAGIDTPAAASTLNMLVAEHIIGIDGTDDWVLPSGVVPGQRQHFIVNQADNIPAGTISGLFYDNADGSADGTDITLNAVGDSATVDWDGARWYPYSLVSATT